jgi:hypothetical protein
MKWNDEETSHDEDKDGDRSSMQKMSISTRANDSSLLDKTTFIPSASQFSTFILESPIGRFIGLVFLILLLYVLLSLQSDESSYQPGSRAGNDSDNTDYFDERQINIRPKRLYDLMCKATILAKKEGYLSSISILSPEYIIEKSMEFMVFLHNPNPQPKDLNRLISDSDPFSKDNIDINLLISAIPPSYSLILNKFNTIDQHSLLITNEYRDQSTPLSEFDLEAWYGSIYMYTF